MFNSRTKFTLKSPLGIFKLDRDPMGWSDTETEVGRSEKTFGIFLTNSNNLQFTGVAKDYLETVYQVYGVNADVKLTKWVKHPQTDEWQFSFEGNLNFTTRKIENNKLKIDFIEGGLREIFVSQLKEKFELNRTESIKGAQITPLVTDELTNNGRDIYLLSRLNAKEEPYYVNSGDWNSGSEYRTGYAPFPLSVVGNSDPENISPQISTNGADNRWNPDLANMFFTVAQKDLGKVSMELSYDFTIKFVQAQNESNVTMEVVLMKFSGGYDSIPLVEIVGDRTIIETLPYPTGGDIISYTFEKTFDPYKGEGIKEGESLTVGILVNGQFGGVSTGFLRYYSENFNGNLVWAEDSFYQRTKAPFLTANETGQKLTEIFSGKKKFISDLLSEGTWKDLGFTCGGWIRNLKIKTETGIEKEWPLTISFEDFYKSIHSVLPVGYGIVTKGAKQFITLEPIRYFFQPYVTIKLGQVSNVKRETAAEYVFSSITTGYSKGGNYEKPLGLDEYNIQSTNITPITVIENKYEALGPSRADSYGVEQARRMQYEDFPDEDTPFDDDNFLIDAKFITRSITRRDTKDYYEVRLWQDDFEQAPTGVYSPETAFNLRLSPANNRNRHALWFNSATVKYNEDKIRFSSSEGNSELKTKFPAKPEVKENGDTLISELSNPIFEPEWVNFDYPFTQDLLDMIQGTTKLNGKEINNYYGLVEFLNEDNQKERGYLFSAKAKDKFTFKILKSYGF
jgi:hypothetical protein